MESPDELAESWTRRIDPWARALDPRDAGVGVVVPRRRTRPSVAFRRPSWDQCVVYELHVGSFTTAEDGGPGTLERAAKKLGYLRDLGINAVLLMPVNPVSGPIDMGFNPWHLQSVEPRYGGATALRRFIGRAHAHGIAVLLTVVLSHAGSMSVHWDADGTGGPGPYFFPEGDPRGRAVWGNRFDLTKPEVCRYLEASVRLWVEEFGVDGIHWDTLGTFEDRAEWTAPGALPIEEGPRLVAEVNGRLRKEHPDLLITAENPQVTHPEVFGQRGCDAYWDRGFLHTVRGVLVEAEDEKRNLDLLSEALFPPVFHKIRGVQRMVFLESHDDAGAHPEGEVPRLPRHIHRAEPESIYARKRSLLGAVLTLTAYGIPMVFQGQEWAESDSFDPGRGLDWDKAGSQMGFLEAMRTLIRLRTGSPALAGGDLQVLDTFPREGVLAYQRTGPHGEAMVVVLHLANRVLNDCRVRCPLSGPWRRVFDTGGIETDPELRALYGDELEHLLDSEPGTASEFSLRKRSTKCRLAPYSAVILLREPAP